MLQWRLVKPCIVKPIHPNQAMHHKINNNKTNNNRKENKKQTMIKRKIDSVKIIIILKKLYRMYKNNSSSIWQIEVEN